MGSVSHPKVKIPWLSAIDSGLALPGKAHPTTIDRPRLDPGLESMGFSRTRHAVDALEGNRALGSTHGLLKSDQDITFNIMPTPWVPPASCRSPRCLGEILWKPVTGAAAEILLEKIAEAGATKMKLVLLTTSAASTVTLPPGRRLKISSLLPAGAKLIILFALLRIAENLVRFIDLFELFVRPRLTFGDVRMVFPSQLTKCLLDFLLCRLP